MVTLEEMGEGYAIVSTHSLLLFLHCSVLPQAVICKMVDK